MLLPKYQLVVEPLNALISSQVEELEQRNVRVVRLLSRKDTPYIKTSPEKIYGPEYMRYLVDNFDNNKIPLIIFTTPELLSTCTEENGPLQALAQKQILSLIVLDEFDYIDECHQQHRNAYTTIVPDLKHAVERLHVPFLYLSATGSNNRMLDILYTISNPYTTSRPILVQTEQILPQSHIYKGTYSIFCFNFTLKFLTFRFCIVEQKSTFKKTVQRIASILEDYRKEKNGHSFARSICYCLTPANCDKAVDALSSMGIKAAAFSSKSNQSTVLKDFHNGTIRVMCATSALGRGVHIGVPIRFIFHFVVPASLTGTFQIKV